MMLLDNLLFNDGLAKTFKNKKYDKSKASLFVKKL